ncbi:hypothetical protein Goshw_016593 [Gossypium schwendimanii]|uniref:Uncharacterized protein n=1 Tax=Gossypium schwendimanii TaxID=34291 RepID=A0A7J9M4N9_GOSSC|nr:hypothetical protein [Gossypium schwendimanii]
MHPLEKFTGIDLGISEYKEKSRRLRLEYLVLVIFPKAPGHIDDTILDLFDQLDKRVTPCGDFDWVPLLGIWRSIGYAYLLVIRQYRSRQFIPATQGLAQCEFVYKCDNYKNKIIKQDFEKKSSELGKRIEKLEEEKVQLGLDIDIQKLEAKKMRKGNTRVEEDLDSLKTNYKKLRLSIRIVGLGKTSE